MNRLWPWYAFWARPTTILTLTTHTATLATTTPRTAYAALTPDPTLLTKQGTLAAGFQLRNFLDTAIPLQDKKPFSLIVIIPSQSPAPQHLAVEIGALLMQLKLPAYCITTAVKGHASPFEALPDILKNCSGPSLPVFRTAILSTGIVCISALLTAAAAHWYAVKPLSKAAEGIVTCPRPHNTRAPAFPLYPLLATAMALHRWDNQLIKLSGTESKHTHKSIMANPATAGTVSRLLSDATHSTWTMHKPRYRAGIPPLYEVTQVSI
ncbi:MAG: hypothetical protein WCJ17_01230 [bacterium]